MSDTTTDDTQADDTTANVLDLVLDRERRYLAAAAAKNLQMRAAWEESKLRKQLIAEYMDHYPDQAPEIAWVKAMGAVESDPRLVEAVQRCQDTWEAANLASTLASIG